MQQASSGSVFTPIQDCHESDTKTRSRQIVNNNDNFKKEPDNIRRYEPDRPIHMAKESMLAWNSGFNKFKGFFIWGILMLCLEGCRLLVENLMKYGILSSPQLMLEWVVHENQNNSYIRTPIYIIVGCIFYFFIAFLIEKGIQKNYVSNKVGLLLHVGYISLLLLIPIGIFRIWKNQFSVVGRGMITVMHLILFMKLWSYVQVNHWCREHLRTNTNQSQNARNSVENSTKPNGKLAENSHSYSQGSVQYPENVNLKDLYYFLVAPTLCYQLNFPRNQNRRLKFIFCRLVEVVLIGFIGTSLFIQWIIPSVVNSYHTFSELGYIACIQRVMKVSIPCHLLFLMGFYLLFQSYLNLIGELTRFGDRGFYRDWWNSKDTRFFWSHWNLPVHHWFCRHIFVPVLNANYSVQAGRFVVFTVSALLHEYAVSVPLRMFKTGVFWGIFLQMPWMQFSERVQKRFGFAIGNFTMWLPLILAPPWGFLAYYHDFVVIHYNGVNA